MEDEATVFSWEAAADLVCRDAPCVRDPAFEGKACGQSFLPWTVLGCHLKVVVREPSHWGPHHVTGKPKRRGHRQPSQLSLPANESGAEDSTTWWR